MPPRREDAICPKKSFGGVTAVSFPDEQMASSEATPDAMDSSLAMKRLHLALSYL